MNKAELLLKLIKDDLIYSKLWFGLHDLGLEADKYTLQLSETIFELAELSALKNTDEIFKNYLNQLQRVKTIDISESPEKLTQLSIEIYNQLLNWNPTARTDN